LSAFKVNFGKFNSDLTERSKVENDSASLGLWYVLQTKPNACDIASANLERQGYLAFMPLQRITRRTRKGLQKRLRPLFPGYLFLSGHESGINWRAIGNTRGVRRVLTVANGQPAELPENFVNDLSRMMDENGIIKASATFGAGDSVRIVNGPMAGWIANVLELNDVDRIRLLLDVMGRKVPFEVAIQDLEPGNAARC
jgi:transcriptional antiterminator RfaH